MAFPAARDTANLNTLYTGARESIESAAQDIVFKETTAMYMAQKYGMYTVGQYSHHHVVPVVDKDDTDVRAYEGYDTLPTQATLGARSAYFPIKKYATNISISQDDEDDIQNAYNLVDLLETRAFKAYRGLSSRLDRDFFWGSGSDTKQIFGLEQAVYAKAASSGTMANVLSRGRWNVRQANNTYAGVARVAFTSTVDGTGWENLSASGASAVHGGSATTDSPILITSGAPSFGLKLLNHMYQLSSYGGQHPDIILSTLKPWEDYLNACQGLIQYFKTDGTTQAGNLGFTNAMFKGAEWVWTERAQASASNGSDASTAAADMIYGLTSSAWKLIVQEGRDFSMSEFVRPVDQAASTAQVFWRGQQVCVNPRYNFVIYNYGV